MSSYETTGVVTDVGIAAAIQDGPAGPQINVGGYRIGANSAADGAIALQTDTDVDGFVYQGTAADMSYSQVDQDTVVWRIRLNSTIGNFPFGNVGLILTDGTLFCKGVLPGRMTKYETSGTTVGNTEYINVLMRLLNGASLLNVEFFTNDDANLPEVPTELQLPSASTTAFDTYLVDNHTHIGVPTLAVRLNGTWWHGSKRIAPGQGQGVLVATAGAFRFDCPALGPVGFDIVADQFVPADADDPQFYCVGVRTSTFEVTTLGTVPGALCGLQGALTPFTQYYAGNAGEGTTGQFSHTSDGICIAIATSTTDLYIDTTGQFQTTPGDEVLADELALIVLNARNTIKLQADTRRDAERTFTNSQRLRAANL